MSRLGLLNYGSGNFASVYNAFEHLGCAPQEITCPSQMQACTHLVLPGVGSFPAAMDKLQAMELTDALREQVLERQKPLLGICVGMQILADEGTEFELRTGLGFIGGRVERISAASAGLPTPHMGWNELTVDQDCPLFRGLPSDPCFYFVHSYGFQPARCEAAVAHCEYGGTVTAAVQRDHIFGVQFHPEKSQRDGLRLLKNFANL